MKKQDDRSAIMETTYLLAYEKQRMRDCADGFKNLAEAFAAAMPEAEEEMSGEEREEYLWRRRLRENRVLLADNLKEVAAIMERTVDDRIKFIRLGGKKEKQLVHSLGEEGILVRDIYLIQGNKERIEVSATMRTKKEINVNVEDVAGYLSVFLDMKLVPAKRSPFFLTQEFECIYFEEDAKYCVLTGVARAVKEDEKVSGDNYSFCEAENGNLTAILSDGMGSGNKACGDSEMVIDMVEKFLDAGISREMTVQMVNSALIAGAEARNMSTLDLCSIDLYHGSCEFIKIGAANAYIKRGHLIEKIPSATLPLGIFNQMSIEKQQRELMDGDFIIMLSDGVLEAAEQGETDLFFQQVISQVDFNNSSEAANFILKYVIGQSKGQIRDDMTVLVIGIWENE